MATRRPEKATSIRWKPGDVAGHELAKGLMLRVESVPDNEHVKATVLRKGETDLREGYVLPFRTKYLVPPAA